LAPNPSRLDWQAGSGGKNGWKGAGIQGRFAPDPILEAELFEQRGNGRLPIYPLARRQSRSSTVNFRGLSAWYWAILY
jgi:hypothetical protein